MQLGKLRAAIRDTKTVYVPISLALNGGIVEVSVAVQKGSLMDELGKVYGNRAAETGMELADDTLRFDGWKLVGKGAGPVVPASDDGQVDLEDWISAAPPVAEETPASDDDWGF